MTLSSEQRYRGIPLVAGRASGTALVLTEPLNAWGGLDPSTGEIVHHSHPQKGADITATVLVLEETRGSGTNAQVLAQTWSEGHGPAAVILARPDYVLCVGAVVSRELYDVACPVVVLNEEDFRSIPRGARIEVDVSADAATVIVRTVPDRPDHRLGA